MADTPILGMPEISESQASKYVTHNEALRLLDVLVQCSVIDKDLSEPPSGTSDGDAYIVGATSSSDSPWNGHDDDIARDENGAWKYETPRAGWIVFVVDEAKYYMFQSPSDGWVELATYLYADAYDVHAHKEGTPSGSEIMLRYSMVRAVQFPDDFSGSQAKAGTAAGDSAGAEFSIQKNGVEFGQMTFASGATTATFNTDSSYEDFAAGDILTVVAPSSPDSTLAGVSFTLKGFII